MRDNVRSKESAAARVGAVDELIGYNEPSRLVFFLQRSNRREMDRMAFTPACFMA